MWQRRAFLQAAGAGFAATLLQRQALAIERAELVYASAVRTPGGSYGAALLTERGDVISTVTLPDRGHDITYSAQAGRAVVFARQPGTFAVVFDPAGQAAPTTLTSPAGRHFYGHGVFSPDGKLLYATESDFEAMRGVIGVYDATGGYRRIAEFPTYGIGPHELLLMPDGKTLVIANGGIQTHPDFGRAELNLDTMDPSICFVDTATGALVGQLRLPARLHQLSIRHMAIAARERVWFGCQYRGPAGDQPQLVGYATVEGDIKLIDLPLDTLGNLRNYIGSVAASADGETVGVASPEGDLVVAIDTGSAKPNLVQTLKNGCGIAAQGQGFVASSGDGEWTGLAGSGVADRNVELSFDNHIAVLG